MLEKTLTVVEGEDACKLFDCFVNYKKLMNAKKLADASGADSVQVSAMDLPEIELVELQK